MAINFFSISLSRKKGQNLAEDQMVFRLFGMYNVTRFALSSQKIVPNGWNIYIKDIYISHQKNIYHKCFISSHALEWIKSIDSLYFSQMAVKENSKLHYPDSWPSHRIQKLIYKNWHLLYHQRIVWTLETSISPNTWPSRIIYFYLC